MESCPTVQPCIYDRLSRRRKPSKSSASPCCSVPQESQLSRATSWPTNPKSPKPRARVAVSSRRSISPSPAVSKTILRSPVCVCVFSFALSQTNALCNTLHINTDTQPMCVLLRCNSSLEAAIDILHTEYEKVESIRAEIGSRKLTQAEETELRDCKVV